MMQALNGPSCTYASSSHAQVLDASIDEISPPSLTLWPPAGWGWVYLDSVLLEQRCIDCCFRMPHPPFLPTLLGHPRPKHTRFSDSSDDEEGGGEMGEGGEDGEEAENEDVGGVEEDEEQECGEQEQEGRRNGEGEGEGEDEGEEGGGEHEEEVSKLKWEEHRKAEPIELGGECEEWRGGTGHGEVPEDEAASYDCGRQSTLVRGEGRDLGGERGGARSDVVRRGGEGRLDACQRAAVSRLVLGGGVLMLHGPPGTGKTSVLVSTLLSLSSLPGRVLVCAPSNRGVQEVLTRLLPHLPRGELAYVADGEMVHGECADVLLSAIPERWREVEEGEGDGGRAIALAEARRRLPSKRKALLSELILEASSSGGQVG